MNRVGIPILLTILLAAGTALSVEGRNSLQTSIAEHRREMRKLSEREAGAVEVLDGISREINLTTQLAGELREEEKRLKARQAALEESLSIARAELESARELQREVVRELYIRGRGSDILFIFGGEGPGGFIRRLSVFLFLAEARRELSEKFSRATKRVENLMTSVEENRREVSESRTLRLAELDSLERARSRQEALLKEIRSDREEYREAIRQMEESLESLKNRLPEATASGDFDAYRGALPWPTESRDILHPFGIVEESRFGTRFRNAGIDIATRPEEPVRSVAGGRIAQTYWLRGYGQIVIVQHSGGFFSVYGNLGQTAVAVGDRIGRGDLIGWTSREGWLEGSKLHFELRKGRQEVNPVEWLAAA